VQSNGAMAAAAGPARPAANGAGRHVASAGAARSPDRDGGTHPVPAS